MIIPISVSEIKDKELIDFVKSRKNYSTFLKNLIYTTMYEENLISKEFFLQKILTDDISNILNKVEINLLNNNPTEKNVFSTTESTTTTPLVDNNTSQRIIKKSEEGILKNLISSIEGMTFNKNEEAI